MKPSEEHESLIVALEADSAEHVLQVLAGHNSKHADVDTKELLQTMPQKQKLRCCKALRMQATRAIEELQSSDPSTQKQQTTAAKEDADIEEQDVAAELLRNIALLCTVLLSNDVKAVPGDLWETAVLLHDNALLAAAEWPDVQDAVASLCMAWWQVGAAGKEAIVAQTLPYLLVRALSLNRSADVKRCYTMRQALSLLDFEDETIDDLKRLLLRAAFSPTFLRCKEGRRYLAHLFTLEPQMVRELGAIIRNQIPSGRKSVLEAYGEILYRAWRESTAACLLEVENQVQGLMQAAISASTQPMAAALRTVLDGFHREKAAPGVDALLLRLYRPILFRALAAANPAVRRNALGVLLDAFPLQDPDASNEETDELLSKQFGHLGDALGDSVPAVRQAAVSGVCKLLNTFWELIPGAVTAGFLKRIAGELAFDGACVGVRAAAVSGLAALAQNPLTHPLMKKMLPTLRPLIWDSAVAVRVALADMLLAIGSLRDLSFVDVVPLDTLLNVLATDSAPVAQRVHRLLVPSYFPGPEDGPACVAALLRQCPEAGKAFCLQLAGSNGASVPVEHVVALVVALRDHVLACAPEAMPEGTPRHPANATRNGKRKKKGDPQPQASAIQAAETPEAWEGLLEGLASLCEGLSQCEEAGELAGEQSLFTGAHLDTLLGLATSPSARSAVLRIAAAIPDSAASASLHSRCLSQLLTSTSGPPSQAELRSALSCLSGADDMAALLDHIITALDAKRPLSAGSRAAKHLRMSPDSALRCLDAMLADEGLRLALLTSQMVTDLLPVLQSLAQQSAHALISGVSATFPGDHAPDDTDPDGINGKDKVANPSLAFPSASIYCRTALHLQLTTAIVSAATLHNDQSLHAHNNDHAELMDGMDEAFPLEAEGDHPNGAPSTGMWQNVGAEAVHEAVSHAQELLSSLQAIDVVVNFTGDLRQSQGQAVRAPKRGRRGKGPPPEAVDGSLGRAALLHSATRSLLGAVALAADAARLLQWGSAGGESAESACALASDLVQWTCRLAARAPEGNQPDWTAVAGATLGHAGKLALHMHAAHKQASASAMPVRSESTLTLATTLLQAGVSSSESWRIAALRPFLTGLVAGLCRQSSTSEDCSWVGPLAAAVGEEVMDSLAAEDGAEEGTAKGRKKGPAKEAADADTENVPQNAQAPGNTGPGQQMTAFKPSHPFVKAVLQAASFSKVQPEMALCAASLAAASQEPGRSGIGAIQLTVLAGFKGAGSRDPQKQYADVLTILEGVHGKLEAEQPNSKESASTAHECMQTMLHALVLPQ
ncbi:Condensin-2 complex subunit G2 [Coccomyxa sp. Obi]|nr:Condensin-2 complex subunit G2 [Coccomyxa sp. Obi]